MIVGLASVRRLLRESKGSGCGPKRARREAAQAVGLSTDRKTSVGESVGMDPTAVQTQAQMDMRGCVVSSESVGSRPIRDHSGTFPELFSPAP